MALFTRSLWPPQVTRPYLRLVAGMVCAPLIIGFILTLGVFFLAGSTEQTRDDVIAETIEAGVALTALSMIVTLTLGVLAIGILWALEQPGIFAWLVAGAVVGGLSALIFGQLLMNDTGYGLLAVFIGAGMVLFVIIRAIAGIQDCSTLA